MESRASIKGHPIHPMLVVFPIGLWVFSFICDLIFLGNRQLVWPVMAYYTMAAGIIGALIAAIPGAIDLYSQRGHRDILRIGVVHMVINLSLVVLFTLNLIWRAQELPGAVGPIVLSALSIGLLAVSGWLGGEMVYRHGAGMSSEAATEQVEAEGQPVPVLVERRHPGNVVYYSGPERRRRA